jgi:predicted dehydrogenase
MKSLVIGMGIGQLYLHVLIDLGHEVVTVDTDASRSADYTSVKSALQEHAYFDTVNICTPNFTHLEIARAVAKHASIVFIEKPGLETSAQWKHLCNEFPKTRFMMVKNNQYRDNINVLAQLAHKAKIINLTWNNNDRVPNPGTWFTTYDLSYGGVSRDLIPHLLSLFQSLSGFTHDQAKLDYETVDQRWKLKDLTETDYGMVNPNGVYDVEDHIELHFNDAQGRKWFIESDWRTLNGDDRSILMIFEDGSRYCYELGLCPEDAYKRMIDTAVKMVDVDAYWQHQYELDMWIHKTIESLDLVGTT